MEIKIKVDVNLDPSMIRKILKIGFDNSAQKLIKKAQYLAPYDTWTLKKSIGTDRPIMLGTDKVRLGPDRVGSRKVPYALRREFENRKNPSRKYYMKRTYQEAKKIVKEEFKKAVNIIIKRL